MDPLTHLLMGGAAAYAVAGGKLGRRAIAVGAAAALLPDVDYAIRSASDPLLAIQHHRGFTHSLVMIPVGGALAALPWLVARPPRTDLPWYLLAATVAYATHPFLDAATTYGTQLFWPFTTYRVGLDWISIIDPLFTSILLLGVILAMVKAVRAPAMIAISLCLLYLAVGSVQRERAMRVQARIAAERGHLPVRGATFPTFANQIVWRSLYQAGDSLYMDRVRVPWFGRAGWAPGAAVERLELGGLAEDALADPRVRHDFLRFAWFSDGWVARAPTEPDVVGDARYSMRPDRFEPVWGVRFSPAARYPTEWVDRSRQRDLGLRGLGAEISGRHPDLRPLP